MRVEKNHISEILQLYEYTMAIGKSLDYKESCDMFLKLLLKRKNLNAAWIIETNDRTLKSTYAIPLGNQIKFKNNNNIKQLLNKIPQSKIIDVNEVISSLSPILITKGCTAIFNLKKQGYLFLYSKKDNLTIKDLTQLQPVINKFSINLKACKAFKEQEELLNNLETQNQELNDYAHMVSHDLKSPLRSIDSLTAWLSEDYKEFIGQEGNKSIKLIRTNVEKMDTLINGILEYSSIGKTKIEVYNVNIDPLIDGIINMILVPNNIKISKNNLPIIKGDKYRLQQLFLNLITNAIKYSNKSKVFIELGADDKDEFWQFYVKDNGKGIEEIYFDKIFKTFEKLENNTSSSGIGLSVVKKIVNLYGGKIWLESTLGEGTTFYFTLKK